MYVVGWNVLEHGFVGLNLAKEITSRLILLTYLPLNLDGNCYSNGS
jgi:hypothetical protein